MLAKKTEKNKNPLLPVTSAKIDVIQCYTHCVSVQFGPSNNLDSTVLWENHCTALVDIEESSPHHRSKLLWTDEVKIELSGHNHQRYIWRRKVAATPCQLLGLCCCQRHRKHDRRHVKYRMKRRAVRQETETEKSFYKRSAILKSMP